jgi:hypothetical protein
MCVRDPDEIADHQSCILYSTPANVTCLNCAILPQCNLCLRQLICKPSTPNLQDTEI